MKRHESNGVVFFNYAVTKKNRVSRACFALGPAASALLLVGAP